MADVQFAQALERYRSLMLKRARAILKNGSDAEDAVQEALERAWRSRERFVPGSAAAPWLLTIARNTALDALRRQNNAELGDASGVPARDRADDGVLRRESAQRIELAVRELAPKHRAAFVLHDVQGLSSREISTRLKLPYHTVRTHLHRARRHLRSALNGVEL